MWGHLPEKRDDIQWWAVRSPLKVSSRIDRWHSAEAGTSQFTAAISQEGSLYTCGINDRGQLGISSDGYKPFLTHVNYPFWSHRVLADKVKKKHCLCTCFCPTH